MRGTEALENLLLPKTGFPEYAKKTGREANSVLYDRKVYNSLELKILWEIPAVQRRLLGMRKEFREPDLAGSKQRSQPSLLPLRPFLFDAIPLAYRQAGTKILLSGRNFILTADQHLPCSLLISSRKIWHFYLLGIVRILPHKQRNPCLWNFHPNPT